MPRTPIDYSKSVIYKIQHLEKDELVYVGSTTNFVNRKNNHKTKSNSNKYKTKVYEMIRENGGWECFNMIIIKEYPCQTRTELEQEEDRIMRDLNARLNGHRVIATEEEKYISKRGDLEKRKIYQKEKYEKNKEQILKERKEYQEKNKEKIAKRKRERYLEKKNNAINLKK